jgi:TRAP-type C4-dicarboxylate transport system permease large subunit
MLIIGMSLLYSYVMSYLHISQSTAQWIVSLQLSRWVLLTAILLMVVVLGFFLPPVSIILMTAPIILPPLKAAGFVAGSEQENWAAYHREINRASERAWMQPKGI